MKLKDGRYWNDRMSTYIIPTSLDAPDFTAVLVEIPSARPLGAKGLGELPMNVGAPAVVAAIDDATRRLDPRAACHAGDPCGARRGRPGVGEEARS